MTQTDSPAATDTDRLEGLYGVTDELVRQVREALDEDRAVDAADIIGDMHAADQADLFERLAPDERELLVVTAEDRLDSEFFAYLDETVRENLLRDLDTEQLANVIQNLESDDAIDLIEDLEEHEQRELLAAMPPVERLIYEEGLRFPEDSAGRLMQREAVVVPSFWTIGQTIDYMRSDVKLPNSFYAIVVLGPTYRPVGMLALNKLMRTQRPVPVTEVMDPDMKVIPGDMDQEDVAFLFRQYGLVTAPVTDQYGRTIGVITVDDVVNVIQEEHEEDMLSLAGVSEDDFYEAVLDTTRSRFPWLVVNLGTAILASLVIGLFDATIEKVVALAVLMPIVASMGGNAGTQTLAVAVRAMATKQLTAANAMRIVGKEVLVGGINGILFAILMGVIAWLWFQQPLIGGVIAVAMVINLLLAGFAGTVIPLALDRMGIDPAVGSSVVLTTVTDVVGFMCFLGLAALVLF